MIRAFITCVTLFVAVPAWAEINIKEVTSPGGINAWLVEEPSIPFVALEIRFKGGTSLDADGARGATNLMVGLLEEGTGDMDAQAFAKTSEELAAQFGYDSHADAVSRTAMRRWLCCANPWWHPASRRMRWTVCANRCSPACALI